MRADYIYSNDFFNGILFQDFAMEVLRKEYGITVQVYSSGYFQGTYGEGPTGIEIKFDKMEILDEYGNPTTSPNLFIESYERPRFTKKNDKGEEIVEWGEWKPSGINSLENIWLLLIGNFNEAFLFSIAQLRQVIKNQGLKEIEIKKQTARGYLFPKKLLEQYPTLCLKHIIFTEKDKKCLKK